MRIHNTAIAMAEDGSILSVYHKHHPFGDEVHFIDTPINQTKGRFTTSFGVRFGMFICFDILWELTDSDVSDFVFLSDWVNNAYAPLPSPSARSAQISWSA